MAVIEASTASAVEPIVDDCLRILQAMHAVGTAAICQMDITMSQVKAMLIVGSSARSTVGSIAESMGVGLPAASAVVDRLVNVGWLERAEDPDDRRRALVTLTAEGRQQIETVWRVRRDMLAGWIGCLSPKARAHLASGLAALKEVALSPESTRGADDLRAHESKEE